MEGIEMEVSLENRNALITGGSSGLGKHMAIEFSKSGANVVIVARSKDQVFEAVNKMKSKGFSVSGTPMDITNIDSVKNLMDKYADIDILVNSAGIARHTPTVDTTEADFDDVMSVNVRSAYFLAQSAAKKMISKGFNLVTVGSDQRFMSGGAKEVIEKLKGRKKDTESKGY